MVLLKTFIEKQFNYTVVVAAFLLFCLSCTTETNEARALIVREEIILSNTEFYTYNLGSFGDEEGAGIKTQAAHFELSEIDQDLNSGEQIYRYQPAEGYTGPDFVELTTSRGSDGSSPNTDVRNIRISFTITQ